MIRSMVSKMIRSMITTVINPFDGLISRYFIPLDALLNSYYKMAAPITFAGDFEIEVDIHAIVDGADSKILSFRNGGNVTNIGLLNSSCKIYSNLGVNTSVGSLLSNGILNKIKIVRNFSSNTYSVYINNILKLTFSAGTFDWSLPITVEIGRETVIGGGYFNGIIANAKFTDKSGASDVTTTFKLDNSPAAANYTYSTELLDNNTFLDNANARQYLVATKGWIITDGGAA